MAALRGGKLLGRSAQDVGFHQQREGTMHSRARANHKFGADVHTWVRKRQIEIKSCLRRFKILIADSSFPTPCSNSCAAPPRRDDLLHLTSHAKSEAGEATFRSAPQSGETSSALAWAIAQRRERVSSLSCARQEDNMLAS
jgi:hypothetical protein